VKIVVTGNIGCGKSTVVQMLSEALPTFQVFDFDKVVHEFYNDPTIAQHLKDAFGSSDRAVISDIVHADPAQMTRLESIINTPILWATLNAFSQTQIILDIPLFFERLSTFPEFLPDVVICVACQPDLQVRRIQSRSGFSVEKIKSILEKQLSQAEKSSRSTLTVHNNGTIGDLRHQLQTILEELSP